MKIPQKVEILELKENYGKFVFSPLERGFGITVGNALRRTLLSSIQGAAISAVKIDGVYHEFSTIKGVYEDVSEIIINLKGVDVKLNKKMKEKTYIEVKKKGKIYAKDIARMKEIEVLNPEHLIFTVIELERPFKVHLWITSGRGYVSRENLKTKDLPVGTIFMDAFYSPVKRVNFSVENTRVGKRTDYDKLIFEIWTNKTISPKNALGLGALILRQYFTPFYELREEKEFEFLIEMEEEKKKLREMLNIKIEDLELSVRCANCLKRANINRLADLVEKTEKEMLKYPNFGRKSLHELIKVLKKYNLSFGMNVKELLKDET
jgi:DNA-directed RNA polymerase subunit alpha